MNILTDYYRALKRPDLKTRYDVVESTASYQLFEQIFINIRNPNPGGLSFYVVDQPSKWGKRSERKTDKAITKGAVNISSIFIPIPDELLGYGDVKNTEDALIFFFSPDWSEIEIFVARGQKNNKQNLYQIVQDGELENDITMLKQNVKYLTTTKSVTKSVNDLLINNKD